MPRKGKKKPKKEPLTPVAGAGQQAGDTPPLPPPADVAEPRRAASPPPAQATPAAEAAKIVAAKLGELQLESPAGSDADEMDVGDSGVEKAAEAAEAALLALAQEEEKAALLAQAQEEGIVLGEADERGLVYAAYAGGAELQEIMALVDRELSEPYSIYTYRYFLVTWPEHCLVVRRDGAMIGCVVAKLEQEEAAYAGYIAMLVVEKEFRGWGVGSKLVVAAIDSMRAKGADEIVLETEVTNKAALRLYERMGFAREERLFRYYLNNNDAFRLKLWLK